MTSRVDSGRYADRRPEYVTSQRATMRPYRPFRTCPYDAVMEAAAVEIERRTSYLELFFDLVFVFAITQVAALMIGDPTAGGYAKAALVLALVYWAWSAYAWATNAIDLSVPSLRLGYLLAIGASFAMAVGVPDAYAERAAWFAVSLFAVRMIQLWLYWRGLRGEPEHRAAVMRLAPWFTVAPTLVLLGAFVDEDLRIAFWVAAVAVDVAGTLRQRAGSGWQISPAHFAERYALFIIIALGESIVAVGTGLADHTKNAAFAAALAVSFVGVAAIWWAYFDFSAAVLARVLANRPPEARGPIARDVFTLGHYPIVLGIIFFAVAAKKTVASPTEPLSGAGRFALAGGVAMFLVGFAILRYRLARHVAYERVAAGLLGIAAVLVFPDVDGLTLMAIVVGILVAGIAWEAVHLRTFRAEVRAGPTQN
jgi:low temperature requirement protein LtrA